MIEGRVTSIQKFASQGMMMRALNSMERGVWYTVEDIRRKFDPPVTVARHYLWSHSTTAWVLRSLQDRGAIVRQKDADKNLYRYRLRQEGDPI